jgi:hypothetical protein
MRQVKSGRRLRMRTSTAVRFRPPAVFISSTELLLPVVHTNFRQLKAVRRILDGSSFYVKAIDKIPQSLPRSYVIMLKLKADARRPNES